MRPIRLAAASFLAVLVACGDAAPRVPARSAAAWAAELESPAAETSANATRALVELAGAQGPAVTDALVGVLSRATPPPNATAFSIRLDVAAAERLGLEPLDAPDAIAQVLSVVRRRLVDHGLSLGSIRGDRDGVIDVVLVGALTREKADRLARDVCRRGALELRALFAAPRIDAAAAQAFAAWREAEIEAVGRAEKEGVAYVPTRPGLRVLRDASVPTGASAPAFVVVTEPGGPADAFDERIVAQATGFVGTDGVARVRITVDPARRADLTRWTIPLVGRDVAIVRDGVVTERARVSVPWSTTIDVIAAGEPSSPPDEAARARADASALALGRLPRPLAPVPAAQARSAAELVAPSLERAVLALGPAAIPALERLERAELPAPRRALVARVLAELRKRAAWTDETIREEKARAARAKEKAPDDQPDPRDGAVNDPGDPPPPK